MATTRSIVVKHLPESLSRERAHQFFAEIAPLLHGDRPSVVFDFSAVRDIDRAGVEILLRCMEEAMKSNGDVKLAAVPPQVAVILELTQVSRLFELYENPADAVESFYRFPVQAFQKSNTQLYPTPLQDNSGSSALT